MKKTKFILMALFAILCLSSEAQSNKDTISVVVLCEKALSCSEVAIKGDLALVQDVEFLGVEICSKRQERTLVWLTVPALRSGTYFDEHRFEKTWMPIDSRWLDPVEGCYQLIPIQN